MKTLAVFSLVLVNAITAVMVVHEGGSCGTNSIPYKITVDSEGKPELSCKTPSCLGADYSPKAKSHGKDMSVICDPFKEAVCVEGLQWTGGLLEVNNGTHRTLKTECCSYEGMSASQKVKSIFLGPGDVYIGGLVEKNGEVGGFDLVKEVRKTVNADNQVQYIVGVHRLPCIISSESSEEYLPVLSRNKRKLRGQVGRIDDYDEERGYRAYAPLRRRSMAARRRALLQRLEDYYDYDYDFPAMRRPMRRSRLPYQENRLWPVQYNKPRAYAENVYEEKSVEAGGPIPPPPSSQFVDSQNVAPAPSTYVEPVQTAPMPPPSGNNYAAPYQPAAYPAYPSGGDSYAGYPAGQQQAAYPAQNSYAVPQPAYPAYPAAQPAYQYPAYQPAYQPAYGSNLNSVFSKFQCFSGDMEVETEEGTKMIKDLNIGDKVLSMDEAFVTYSPIIMFLHKLEDEVAEFNLIETGNGHSIKLTDNHLIYVSDCAAKSDLKLVAAKDVKMEDCIHVTNDKNVVVKRKVARMSKVVETGIYSPLTSTGDIIVNRVLASCHSNLALKSLQQTFFSLYKRASNTFHNIVFFKSSVEDGHLPLGLETITSVMDLFVPQSFV